MNGSVQKDIRHLTDAYNDYINKKLSYTNLFINFDLNKLTEPNFYDLHCFSKSLTCLLYFLKKHYKRIQKGRFPDG